MTRAEQGWRDGEPESGGPDEGAQSDESTPRHGTPGLAESIGQDGATGPHDSMGPDETTGPGPRGRPVRAASEADLLVDNDSLLEMPAREDEPGAGEEQRAQLVETGERGRFTARWQEIQAGFVDEPARAVQDAESLVTALMQRLAELIAAERDRLGAHPGTGGDVSTEELRQALRRYRSLFEHLLAA